MRRAITLAIAVLALAAPASASAFRFTFDPADPTVERAISFQVNRQVAQYYAVDPVSFGPGGIPVYMTSLRSVQREWRALGGSPDASVSGFHSYDTTTGRMTVWVWRSTDRDIWTQILSHEVIETAVDPSGSQIEIADPVADFGYRLWGVALSDWVLPSGRPFHSRTPLT